ncbi:4'-phosphopantetheinyl transferase family protein [Streptantibioticus silvisoli]|uniref:4'-phosphopantetheinyl transferase superfamily protein n=1 Tax=Streptantibioticus silvisoli TaxID=2705255 RepID=A0ABT6W6P3_9ACTN|nr:4'-phosphopantetheinyl transferase superfamily protein [Streptantibioticus silvisoli]MDI5966418.1 4'-phosphopantetheinyl transferase superfamily protein [Streptantibioticus silvisoli]
MIEELLPGKISVAEVFGELPDAVLFPEEEAFIARAVESRRREFATVRACARRALAGLGVAPAPILPDGRGAPGWPAGVVGSMTHCRGYRASAVSTADDLVSLGIDAEPAGPLPDGVLEAVSLPSERRRMAELQQWERESGGGTGLGTGAGAGAGTTGGTGAGPGAGTAGVPAGGTAGGTAARGGPAQGQVTHWDRLLFSAKESMFKTWYPLMKRQLDFSEAEFVFRTDGTFDARLLVPGPVVDGQRREHYTGAWLSRDGFVLTALTLRR